MGYWNKHGAPENWINWTNWTKLIQCWTKTGLSVVCFIEERIELFHIIQLIQS